MPDSFIHRFDSTTDSFWSIRSCYVVLFDSTIPIVHCYTPPATYHTTYHLIPFLPHLPYQVITVHYLHVLRSVPLHTLHRWVCHHTCHWVTFTTAPFISTLHGLHTILCTPFPHDYLGSLRYLASPVLVLPAWIWVHHTVPSPACLPCLPGSSPSYLGSLGSACLLPGFLTFLSCLIHTSSPAWFTSVCCCLPATWVHLPTTHHTTHDSRFYTIHIHSESLRSFLPPPTTGPHRFHPTIPTFDYHLRFPIPFHYSLRFIPRLHSIRLFVLRVFGDDHIRSQTTTTFIDAIASYDDYDCSYDWPCWYCCPIPPTIAYILHSITTCCVRLGSYTFYLLHTHYHTPLFYIYHSVHDSVIDILLFPILLLIHSDDYCYWLHSIPVPHIPFYDCSDYGAVTLPQIQATTDFYTTCSHLPPLPFRLQCTITTPVAFLEWFHYIHYSDSHSVIHSTVVMMIPTALISPGYVAFLRLRYRIRSRYV